MLKWLKRVNRWGKELKDHRENEELLSTVAADIRSSWHFTYNGIKFDNYYASFNRPESAKYRDAFVISTKDNCYRTTILLNKDGLAKVLFYDISRNYDYLDLDHEPDGFNDMEWVPKKEALREALDWISNEIAAIRIKDMVI